MLTMVKPAGQTNNLFNVIWIDREIEISCINIGTQFIHNVIAIYLSQ